MPVPLVKTYKYELTIYGPSGRPCGESFTWGTSPEEAQERANAQAAERPTVWAGHRFEVHPRPTLTIPTNKIPRG